MDVNSLEGYRNSLPLDVIFKLNDEGYDYSSNKRTDIEGLKYSICDSDSDGNKLSDQVKNVNNLKPTASMTSGTE